MKLGRLTYIAPFAALVTASYAGCSSNDPASLDDATAEAQQVKGPAAASDTDERSIRSAKKRKCGGIAGRDDVKSLPAALKTRLCELAERPHAYTPMTAFSEADSPSMLFQHYLIDAKGFQPNVFTAEIPGINDGTKPTATGPNGNRPAVWARSTRSSRERFMRTGNSTPVRTGHFQPSSFPPREAFPGRTTPDCTARSRRSSPVPAPPASRTVLSSSATTRTIRAIPIAERSPC